MPAAAAADGGNGDDGCDACRADGADPWRLAVAVMTLARLRRLPAMPMTVLRDLRTPTGDLSTPEGRARERRRRATLSALMSMAAKIISVSTALLTVPITLHYLGAERYGMWMILSSLVAMLSFADLGIGNGILNTVGAAHGRDDVRAMQQGISSGIAVLSALAVVILIGFALAYPHVAWHRFFNVNSPRARAEAGPAIAVFMLCFASAIPVGVVQRVEIGLQRGFLASVWQCGGSIVALCAVLLAVRAEAGLPVLVAAFTGAPLLANVCNSFFFFGWQRRELAPRLSGIDRHAAREVMQTGLLFLVLQVTAAVMFNSDSVIIAQILGARSVAQFAVPERLFSLITIVLSMMLGPLWPAYREAIARGDVAWARRTLLASLRISAGYAVLLSGALFLAAPFIIHMWVGDAVKPSMLLLGGLALWKIAECIGLALSMFLNGAHLVKPQAIIATVTAVASILLEIALVKTIGVAGAVWATLVAFTLLTLVPFGMMTPNILRRLGRRGG